MSSNDIIELAKDIAEQAHYGQMRRNGMPYITHCQAVASDPSLGGTTTLVASAWLHNVIKDTGVTAEDLFDTNLGAPIVETVVTLTHNAGEEYLDYILRVRQCWAATKVKLADIKHNLSDLGPGHQRDKYLMARHLLRGYDFDSGVERGYRMAEDKLSYDRPLARSFS